MLTGLSFSLPTWLGAWLTAVLCSFDLPDFGVLGFFSFSLTSSVCVDLLTSFCCSF